MPANINLYLNHISRVHTGGREHNSVGRRGHRQHEGKAAGQGGGDHQVQRVGVGGLGQLRQDRQQDVGGGHVGGHLGYDAGHQTDH